MWTEQEEIRKLDEELSKIESAIKVFATAPGDAEQWKEEDLNRYLELNKRHEELLTKLANLEWNRNLNRRL